MQLLYPTRYFNCDVQSSAERSSSSSQSVTIVSNVSFGVAKWRVGRKCDGLRVLVEVVGGQQCSLRGVALNSSSTHALRVSVRKASPCLHRLARFSRVGVVSHFLAAASPRKTA